MPFKDTMRRHPTLKELQEKRYPFLDSGLPGTLDELLEKGAIQLLEPKRLKEVGRTPDPKYYRYHRLVSHPLEKCITIKERIMQLAKEGRIILDLDDVVGANHIYSQTRELCTLHFGNLEPVVLFKPCLVSLDMKGKSFSVVFLDRTMVNMTSCSELEEEIDEEGVRKENYSRETDKIVAALEAMLVCLNWGQIFSLPNEIHQHTVITLQHLEIYIERVKGAVEVAETPVQCASCNIAVISTDDDILLDSKPHNRPLFVADYIKEHKVDRILIDGWSAINIMRSL